MRPLQRLQGINLRGYLNIFRKNMVILLGITILLTLFGAFLDLASPRIYETKSAILVANPSGRLPLAYLLNSEMLANRVGRRLDLKQPSPKLLRSVKATLVKHGNIVRIEVKGTDPDRIKRIATYWAREFVNLVKRKIANTDMAATMPDIHIIPAEKVKKVSKGEKTMFFFGIGLFFGIIGAVLREMLDPRLKKGKEVEEATKMPFLGFVPSGQKENATEKELDLISYIRPDSLVAESFRNIKTSMILASRKALPMKTLIVTSSLSDEGRTFIASNLAIQFAKNDKKVLILDASSKRGRLGESLAVEQRLEVTILGLSDVLYGKCSLEEAIARTPVPGLMLLESGTLAEKPEELIYVIRFQSILNELQKNFDHIIIDGASLSGSDAILNWVDASDGIMFVIGAEITGIKDIKAARQKLSKRYNKVIGAILNSVWSEKNLDDYFRDFQSFLGKSPKEQ
ncbi:MAG: polysaccharide biosynthesis tyrosine autokinase [Candidatus Omnitrophica bacterium]|nr:polysaccharide biosynthesis tyrosine autokinase [Candidatus Omnitrophota bacterium]